MRIVVIHDSATVTKILVLILSDAGHNVVLASSESEIADEVAQNETHAVIIGSDSGSIDSYQLCKDLRAARYHGPIMFVSHKSGLDEKLKAFEYGADDYLLEPFEPDELLARVEAMARRCRNLDQQPLGAVVKVDDAELSIGEMTFKREGEPPVTLTPTEMRLLERLMRNAGITISRDTLIERTWGFDYFGESNRVDVYIARIRKKIEPDPARPRYLQTVRGSGYVFRTGDSRPSGLPKLHLVESEISAFRSSAMGPDAAQ